MIAKKIHLSRLTYLISFTLCLFPLQKLWGAEASQDPKEDNEQQKSEKNKIFQEVLKLNFDSVSQWQKYNEEKHEKSKGIDVSNLTVETLGAILESKELETEELKKKEVRKVVKSVLDANPQKILGISNQVFQEFVQGKFENEYTLRYLVHFSRFKNKRGFEERYYYAGYINIGAVDNLGNSEVKCIVYSWFNMAIENAILRTATFDIIWNYYNNDAKENVHAILTSIKDKDKNIQFPVKEILYTILEKKPDQTRAISGAILNEIANRNYRRIDTLNWLLERSSNKVFGEPCESFGTTYYKEFFEYSLYRGEYRNSLGARKDLQLNDIEKLNTISTALAIPKKGKNKNLETSCIDLSKHIGEILKQKEVYGKEKTLEAIANIVVNDFFKTEFKYLSMFNVFKDYIYKYILGDVAQSHVNEITTERISKIIREKELEKSFKKFFLRDISTKEYQYIHMREVWAGFLVNYFNSEHFEKQLDPLLLASEYINDIYYLQGEKESFIEKSYILILIQERNPNSSPWYTQKEELKKFIALFNGKNDANPSLNKDLKKYTVKSYEGIFLGDTGSHRFVEKYLAIDFLEETTKKLFLILPEFYKDPLINIASEALIECLNNNYSNLPTLKWLLKNGIVKNILPENLTCDMLCKMINNLNKDLPLFNMLMPLQGSDTLITCAKTLCKQFNEENSQEIAPCLDFLLKKEFYYSFHPTQLILEHNLGLDSLPEGQRDLICNNCTELKKGYSNSETNLIQK